MRAKTMKRVEEIAAAYEKRFNQDSVFQMVVPTCAG